MKGWKKVSERHVIQAGQRYMVVQSDVSEARGPLRAALAFRVPPSDVQIILVETK